MKKAAAAEPWREPLLGPCACSQLRRTSRAVSALYDQYLASAGLTVTQYAVLVTIGRAGTIQRTQLAGKLGMERTTLTRNLRPLERDGLVAEMPGEDRRERLVALSEPGRARLDEGFECWQKAQSAFLEGFGKDRLEGLRQILASAAAAAASTVSRT